MEKGGGGAADLVISRVRAAHGTRVTSPLAALPHTCAAGNEGGDIKDLMVTSLSHGPGVPSWAVGVSRCLGKSRRAGESCGAFPQEILRDFSSQGLPEPPVMSLCLIRGV